MNLKEIPLNRLLLSDRVKKVLLDTGICTAYDLVQTPLNSFEDINGIGKKALDEIYEIIKKLLLQEDYSSILNLDVYSQDKNTVGDNQKFASKLNFYSLKDCCLYKNDKAPILNIRENKTNSLNNNTCKIEQELDSKLNFYSLKDCCLYKKDKFNKSYNIVNNSHIQAVEDSKKDCIKKGNDNKSLENTKTVITNDIEPQSSITELMDKVFDYILIYPQNNEEFLSMPIDFLNTTIRTKNGIKNMNIHTIGELLNESIYSFMKTRNIGAKSFEEIKELLKTLGEIQEKLFIFAETLNTDKKSLATDITDSEKKSIDFLHLSQNDIISLKNCHIETIADFLSFPPEKYLSEYSFSSNQFMRVFQEFAKLKSKPTMAITLKEFLVGNRDFSILDKNEILYDLKIEKLYIKDSSFNFLKTKGFKTLRDILKFSYLEIKNFFGKIGFEDLIENIKNKIYIYDNLQYKLKSKSINLLKLIKVDIENSIANYYNHSLYIEVFHNIEPELDYIYRQSKSISDLIKNEGLINKIYDNKKIINYAESIFLEKMPILKWITKDYLRSLVPQHLQLNIVFDKIIHELNSKNKIISKNGLITKRISNYMDFVNNITNEKAKIVCSKRYENYTLEEIGELLNLTRERVRQIFFKANLKKPIVFEDIYSNIYTKYDINENQFKYIFGETSETYTYLRLIYKKGEMPLSSIFNDNDISDKIKIKYEKYLDLDKFNFQGEKVLKDKKEVLKYYIKKNCNSYIRFNDLYEKFVIFLQQNIPNWEDFSWPKRYLESRISGFDYVILSNRYLRYFDKTEINSVKLIRNLDFEKYRDLEISAKLIYDNNLDLMESLDIRDEYELHNLLRFYEKAIPKKYNLTFCRTPSLIIGKGNRLTQLSDMLKKYSNYTYSEIAVLFEKKYGFLRQTVNATFFKELNASRNENNKLVNSIDNSKLKDTSILESFSKYLVEDIYQIEAVNEKFAELYPTQKVLNENDFHFMGYSCTSSLIYKNSYKTFKDCVQVMLCNDIVDFSNEKEFLYRDSTVHNNLLEKQKNLDLIEFMPKKYVNTNKFYAYSVSKDDLIDFCNNVEAFVEENYFTIFMLKKDGFSHKIDNLGFDDYFYSALLKSRPNCKVITCGYTKIFNFTYEQFSITDFFYNIIEKYKSVEIYDLKELLENDYGINISVDKIVSIIKDSDLYYSNTMKTVYITYDKFLEEF